MQPLHELTFLQHAKHAVFATFVAECCTLPLCCLKTKMQNDKLKRDASTIAKEMYKLNGVKSFYNASIPAITSQIISTAMKYTLYKQLQNNVELFDHFPNVNNVVCGIVSGCITSVITHPVDVIKVHYQMAGCENFQKRNIYRGYSKALGKVIVGNAFFLPLNDFLKPIVRNNLNAQASDLTSNLISSGLTAVFATLCVHPIDLLKTRHMYGNTEPLACSRRVYFRGLSLHLARIVPHFAITMTLISWLSKV